MYHLCLVDGETDVKGMWPGVSHSLGAQLRQSACLLTMLLLHAVQGLSVVASLVMPLKEGTQERGFRCHCFQRS